MEGRLQDLVGLKQRGYLHLVVFFLDLLLLYLWLMVEHLGIHLLELHLLKLLKLLLLLLEQVIAIHWPGNHTHLLLELYLVHLLLHLVHLLRVVLHVLYLHFMALFNQLVDLLQLFQVDFFHFGSLYNFLQSPPIHFLTLRIFALFILLEHRLVFAFVFVFLSICIMNRVNTVDWSLIGNFTFIHVL